MCRTTTLPRLLAALTSDVAEWDSAARTCGRRPLSGRSCRDMKAIRAIGCELLEHGLAVAIIDQPGSAVITYKKAK